ncbi:MAG: hypothetical protein CMH57_07285 [Myxococcales bacterium]|nr:hypothetical protein [Myxococcales bacterium]
MTSRRLRHALPWLIPLALIAAWVGLRGVGGEPAPDGFTVLLDGAPKGLDPRFATSDFSVKLSRLVFSSLISSDTPGGKPELDLATDIQITSPTTIAVTLRDDAFWHDGEPVTAEDVRFTLTTLDDEGIDSPYAGLSRRIERIDVHDPHRLTIHLTQPHAPFLHDLAIGIVPKHRMTEQGLFPDGVIVGSGPFRFADRKGDAWTALEAFDRHHGGAPALERVIFRTIRDDNARLLAMMGGSGQLLQNAVAPLLLPALQGDRDLVIESSPSFKYTYIGFNVTHPILSDARVRQAIALGIDREEIIEHKFAGLARPATGLLAPSHWAYTADVATWGHDPARARALLDQAGYTDPDGPDGPQPRFELVYKTTTNQFRRSIAELIAMQLAEIGIAVKVQAYEWGTFFGDIKSRNFELCSLQWPSVIEPDLYSWIFHSRSIPTAENRSAGANRGGYSNPEIDRLLDEARAEMDRDARARLYHKVQAILAEELPYISLWHEDNIVVRQRAVQGYQPVPNARFSGLVETRWAP